MDSQLKLKAKKRNLFVLNYTIPENKITESFVKMLEKSKPSITSKLLELLEIGVFNGDFQYDLQVNHDIGAVTPKPIVLGIEDSTANPQENVPPISDVNEDEDGVPDAYIYTTDNSIHILTEVKVGNNRLNENQLNKHSERYININKQDVIVVRKTWDEIRESLIIIIKDYDEIHRNYLLISEFLDLISPKFHQDIYEYSKYANFRDIYLYLDKYIQGLLNVSVRLKNKDETIDYLKEGKNFVTIFPRKAIVILKPIQQLEMQKVVNAVLEQEHFLENELYDERITHKKSKNEGVIRLELVNNLTLVKDLIRITYNIRKMNGK
jgi:hypothetical protein